jgi:hypothetical protein
VCGFGFCARRKRGQHRLQKVYRRGAQRSNYEHDMAGDGTRTCASLNQRPLRLRGGDFAQLGTKLKFLLRFYIDAANDRRIPTRIEHKQLERFSLGIMGRKLRPQLSALSFGARAAVTDSVNIPEPAVGYGRDRVHHRSGAHTALLKRCLPAGIIGKTPLDASEVHSGFCPIILLLIRFSEQAARVRRAALNSAP